MGRGRQIPTVEDGIDGIGCDGMRGVQDDRQSARHGEQREQRERGQMNAELHDPGRRCLNDRRLVAHLLP